MTYELWEIRSGNLMGAFDTEEEALGAVRRAIDRYGVAYVETVALLGVLDEEGASVSIACGPELVARAHQPPTPA